MPESACPQRLDFAEHGAQLFPAAACLPDLHSSLARLSGERPGHRLALAELSAVCAQQAPVGRIAASVLGALCRPVRAVLFDKHAGANWALGWHQDRTICVRERRPTPGFDNWTVKQGLNHVEPPFELLARMITLRIHLDDTPADNAPLLIAPGSHRLGRLSEDMIASAVHRCGTVACTAQAGDVWLYSTPILHASERAAKLSPHRRRRVLHIDFAAEALPGGLEWLAP